MSTKIIRYKLEEQGSPALLGVLKKIRREHEGLGKSNEKLTKTVRLNDRQVAKITLQYDKYGKRLKYINHQIHTTGVTANKSSAIMGQYQKALMRVAIVVPVWMAMRMAMQAVFGAIKSGITAYKEFEQEMGRVATVTLATGATLQEFNKLKKAGIEYAQRSTVSLKETATAMYQLATAGISAKDTIQGFGSVLDLAIGTMNSVEQTGKLMAGAFKLFGNELSYAGDTTGKFKMIADTLAYTFKTQQVELQEVSNAFGYVANAANAVDFDFKSLVGTIGFLNTGMLKGSKAGTSLMNALVRMGGKLGKLEQLTGKAFDPRKPIDFVEVIKALHDKIGEGKVSWETYGQLMTTFGRRGARAVLSILQRYKEWDKSIHVSSASMRDASEQLRIELENNVPKQLEKIKSKWDAAWTEMGEIIGKAVLPALKKLNESLEQAKKQEMASGILWKLQSTGTSGSLKDQTDLLKLISKLDISDLEQLSEKFETLDSGTSKHSSKVLTMVDIYKKIKDKMKEAAEAGEDFGRVLALGSIYIDKNTKSGELLLGLLSDLKDALKKAAEEENNFANAGILTREKFKDFQAVKKAAGVSNIQLIQDELNYLKQVQKITGKTQEIQKLEQKSLVEQTKQLEKQRGIIRGIMKSSLADAMKTGDLSGAFDGIKEGLKNAFYEAAAEGLTNQVMNLTGLDTILGKGLETMNIERAFDDGSMKTEMAIVNGFTKGVGMIPSGAGIGGVGGLGGAGVGIGSMPRVSTGVKPAGTMENWFGAGGNMWKLAGFGMMGASLFGGGSKSSSSHRYSTAPTSTTSAATTRSTVKALVTNITVAPVFQLDGMSIDSKNLVKEVEGKLTPLIKDITARILENESISSGNI